MWFIYDIKFKTNINCLRITGLFIQSSFISTVSKATAWTKITTRIIFSTFAVNDCEAWSPCTSPNSSSHSRSSARPLPAAPLPLGVSLATKWEACSIAFAVRFDSLSVCTVKHRPISSAAFAWIWADGVARHTSDFIQLLQSDVTSSTISDSVLLAAAHAHSSEPTPPCLTAGVVGSWVVSFYIRFLLQVNLGFICLKNLDREQGRLLRCFLTKHFCSRVWPVVFRSLYLYLMKESLDFRLWQCLLRTEFLIWPRGVKRVLGSLSSPVHYLFLKLYHSIAFNWFLLRVLLSVW